MATLGFPASSLYSPCLQLSKPREASGYDATPRDGDDVISQTSLTQRIHRQGKQCSKHLTKTKSKGSTASQRSPIPPAIQDVRSEAILLTVNATASHMLPDKEIRKMQIKGSSVVHRTELM